MCCDGSDAKAVISEYGFSTRRVTEAGKDGEIRRLRQLCVPGFEDPREVPYATLEPGARTRSQTLLYYDYSAAAREFDYASSAGLGTPHLLNYDLKTGKTEDVGELRLEDGRRVRTNAADTGSGGAIYLVGAIEVWPEPGKPVEASERKIGGAYDRPALLIYRPRS